MKQKLIIKDVVLWGSGKPKREFLHVDDLARAIYFTLKNDLEDNLYNIGSGRDLSISELSKIIMKIIGYEEKFIGIKPNLMEHPEKF